jgi:hypothetical protein
MRSFVAVLLLAVPAIWWTPKQHHGWASAPPKYCAQFPCYENRARLHGRR